MSWQNPNFYSLFDILLMWYARKRANLGNKYIPSRLLIIELFKFWNPIRLYTFQMICLLPYIKYPDILIYNCGQTSEYSLCIILYWIFDIYVPINLQIWFVFVFLLVCDLLLIWSQQHTNPICHEKRFAWKQIYISNRH